MDKKTIEKIDEVIEHLCGQVERTVVIDDKVRLTAVLGSLLSARAKYGTNIKH